MNKTRLLAPALFAALAALLCCASCRGPESGADGRIVFVSIPPQQYFVERIAGHRVQTRVLIAQGQSPHSYTPTPRQIAQLSEADVYMTVGIPFEDSVVKKIRGQNRTLEITDMARGIERAASGEHGHEGHGHEGQHGEMDAHVWLDPRNAIVMAQNAADTLAEMDPGNKAKYMENRDALIQDLQALHASLSEKLAPFQGRRFYVYHPAFGYLARAYGLEQVAVETGGKEPTARALDRLIAQARRDNVRVIFVQPQFSQKSAQRVAREIGGSVTAADPLAGDYIANMRAMADAITSGLEQ